MARYPGQEGGRSPTETRRSTSGRTFRDGYSASAAESDLHVHLSLQALYCLMES
jgi:hypothetical protein